MRQEGGGEGGRRRRKEYQKVRDYTQSQSQICFGEQIDRSRHFLALEPTIALFREAATWETETFVNEFH